MAIKFGAPSMAALAGTIGDIRQQYSKSAAQENMKNLWGFIQDKAQFDRAREQHEFAKQQAERLKEDFARKKAEEERMDLLGQNVGKSMLDYFAPAVEAPVTERPEGMIGPPASEPVGNMAKWFSDKPAGLGARFYGDAAAPLRTMAEMAAQGGPGAYEMAEPTLKAMDVQRAKTQAQYDLAKDREYLRQQEKLKEQRQIGETIRQEQADAAQREKDLRLSTALDIQRNKALGTNVEVTEDPYNPGTVTFIDKGKRTVDRLAPPPLPNIPFQGEAQATGAGPNWGTGILPPLGQSRGAAPPPQQTPAATSQPPAKRTAQQIAKTPTVNDVLRQNKLDTRLPNDEVQRTDAVVTAIQHLDQFFAGEGYSKAVVENRIATLLYPIAQASLIDKKAATAPATTGGMTVKTKEDKITPEQIKAEARQLTLSEMLRGPQYIKTLPIFGTGKNQAEWMPFDDYAAAIGGGINSLRNYNNKKMLTNVFAGTMARIEMDSQKWKPRENKATAADEKRQFIEAMRGAVSEQD